MATTEELSPWSGLIDSIIPMLQGQMGSGSGPMYPGVMAAGRSPMQDMARQMMMNRAGGGPRSSSPNPFAQPGYRTGDLGSGQMGGGPQQGGQGMPDINQLMAMLMGGAGAQGAQGAPGGGGPGGGGPPRGRGELPREGPGSAGPGAGTWLDNIGDIEMWSGAKKMMGSSSPFFTPAANPWAPYGGQNPGAKGAFLTPLLKQHTAVSRRQADKAGGGDPTASPGDVGRFHEGREDY